MGFHHELESIHKAGTRSICEDARGTRWFAQHYDSEPFCRIRKSKHYFITLHVKVVSPCQKYAPNFVGFDLIDYHCEDEVSKKATWRYSSVGVSPSGISSIKVTRRAPAPKRVKRGERVRK